MTIIYRSSFQDFITAIPLSKWDQKLLMPAEQCASNGYSCIQTSYTVPTDAVKIEIENRYKGGDGVPYYILDRRASLKHLKVGEVCVGQQLYLDGQCRSLCAGVKVVVTLHSIIKGKYCLKKFDFIQGPKS